MTENSTSKTTVIILQPSPGQSHALHYLTLSHPNQGPTVFALCSITNCIYELQSVTPKKHMSWFINQSVSSSSCYYVANVSPTFSFSFTPNHFLNRS